MRINASQVKKVTGGKFVVNPNSTADFAIRANFDSRTCKCGDMFVAFRGEKVDGSKFISNAINAGATIVLSDGFVDNQAQITAKKNHCAIVSVEDSLEALTKIAAYNRQNCSAKVIGITGSCGKTSTKTFVRDVLSYKFNVTATRGNYNNEIGVPVTLCDANVEDDFLVVEMGMRGRNEISSLCAFVQPDTGIITNVGQSHIELLGSVENIAKAKAELTDSLTDGIGCAVLNAQDEFLPYIIQRSKLRERDIEIILFGDNHYNKEFSGKQVFAQNVNLDEQGFAVFDLCYCDSKKNVSCLCKLNVPGSHNVFNACCAASIGLMYGMPIEDCSRALELSKPEGGRLKIVSSDIGYKIIDDSYNANPQSMKASLFTFVNMKTAGKHIAILGDMAELGDYAEQSHIEIGKYVAKLDIDQLICVGQLAKIISDNAKIDSNVKVSYFESNDEAVNFVKKSVKVNDLVLVKASNSLRFNEIVKGLI